MAKIQCTFEDYDKYEELFQNMYFQAGRFAPTVGELKQVILPNLEGYILFLLWIDITGIETADNTESHQLIRQVLRQNLELVDSI